MKKRFMPSLAPVSIAAMSAIAAFMLGSAAGCASMWEIDGDFQRFHRRVPQERKEAVACREAAEHLELIAKRHRDGIGFQAELCFKQRLDQGRIFCEQLAYGRCLNWRIAQS